MLEHTVEAATFRLRRGTAPLLVSMPHIGTEIPEDLADAYQPRALAVEDTDWHLAELYDFLPALGASVLMPRLSRYVIDLNRPPDDVPMYPGASNTELCPTRFFTGDALYRPGCEPNQAEQAARRDTYWSPYHTALGDEIRRIKARYGYALLWDAHSIRSQISWLFEGRLPDLNVGTASGASADASIAQAVMEAIANRSNLPPDVTSVLNGRFKGGYITRRYGAPQHRVHAVQLEMCQLLYMQEQQPFAFDVTLAIQIRPLLKSVVTRALAACTKLYGA